MARRTIPLSDTQIKKAKPKEKGYKLFDGDGLFIWISPTGGKLWRLKYTSPVSSKEKTFSIGKYPDITLVTARAERVRLRQLVKNGIDPSGEKQENKKVQIEIEIKKTDTLGKLSEDFLKHKTKISDDYRKMQLSRLDRHVFPTLKNTPITEITRTDFIQLVKTIEANITS